MKKALLIFVSVIVLFLLWMEYKDRNVYYNKDKSKCFTVWKTLGGNCYIIPYRYQSIIRPTKDYLITSNKNIITVVWDKRKPNYDFILINNSGYDISSNLLNYHVKCYDTYNPQDTAILNEEYYMKSGDKELIDTMDCKEVDIFNL